MNCRGWERMLVTYLSGDLTAPDRERLEAHLENCPSCRNELALRQAIVDAAGEIGRESAVAEKTVDWSGMEQVIREAAGGRDSGHRWTVAFRWAVAACILLVAGIVWMAAPRMRAAAPRGSFQVDNRTLNRMESELAREEVADYLKKSRLILTELMEQCPTGEQASRWKPSPAIRKLMAEKRLFAGDLETLPLRNARMICRRLDMVFTELVGMDRTRPCPDVHRLQELVTRDQLLLKIRLVEQELKGSEG